MSATPLPTQIELICQAKFCEIMYQRHYWNKIYDFCEVLSSSNLAILSIKAIEFPWQIFLYKSSLWAVVPQSSWCLWIFISNSYSIVFLQWNGDIQDNGNGCDFQDHFGIKGAGLQVCWISFSYQPTMVEGNKVSASQANEDLNQQTNQPPPSWPYRHSRYTKGCHNI